ncbi:hypothetical protein EJB05_51488, partial [Eragrostis curvula]
MALKCAVELGIPTAIHRFGGAASVPDLITGLSLPQAKLPFLRRLMRLLATSGVFTFDSSTEVYGINALSYLLVEGITDDRHINHTSFLHTATSSRYIEAAMGLADWFKKDILTHPFEDLHGVKLFQESMANHDADYHKMANDALAAHDNLGDGDDPTPRAIVKAFPHIKCTVLANPKLIGTIPGAVAVINYVAGDMLKFVPPAQVVVLYCTTGMMSNVLRSCLNARRQFHQEKTEEKVLIGDIVIESSPGPMRESHLLMDIGMMTMTEGRERDENEWRDIFMKAGFSDYKLLSKFGALGLGPIYVTEIKEGLLPLLRSV